MNAGSRFLAVILAGIVWAYAGYAAASGPLVTKAITPAALGAAVQWVIAARP